MFFKYESFKTDTSHKMKYVSLKKKTAFFVLIFSMSTWGMCKKLGIVKNNNNEHFYSTFSMICLERLTEVMDRPIHIKGNH